MCTYNEGVIPSIEQIDAWHRRYAPSRRAYALIHTHCEIVATIAVRVARRANALYAQGRAPAQLLQLYDGAADSENFAPRPIDEKLVEIGGLLHDIGGYQVLRHGGSVDQPPKFDGRRYILHGLLGYRLLLSLHVDKAVAEFARNHTGVGISRRQVVEEHLPLPPADYVPQNLEQEVVMYADKFHSKHNPPWFVSETTAGRRAARYGHTNVERWRALVHRYGVPVLDGLARQYHMPIV